MEYSIELFGLLCFSLRFYSQSLNSICCASTVVHTHTHAIETTALGSPLSLFSLKSPLHGVRVSPLFIKPGTVVSGGSLENYY